MDKFIKINRILKSFLESAIISYLWMIAVNAIVMLKVVLIYMENNATMTIEHFYKTFIDAPNSSLFKDMNGLSISTNTILAIVMILLLFLSFKNHKIARIGAILFACFGSLPVVSISIVILSFLLLIGSIVEDIWDIRQDKREIVQYMKEHEKFVNTMNHYLQESMSVQLIDRTPSPRHKRVKDYRRG